MSTAPSTNVLNGRDNKGRLAHGNPGGSGNPHAWKVAKLWQSMLCAVTESEMIAIIQPLVNLAKSGSVPAAKEVLDRRVGRPVEADPIERLTMLEPAAVRRTVVG